MPSEAGGVRGREPWARVVADATPRDHVTRDSGRIDAINQAIYERECAKAILNAVAQPLVVLSANQQIQSGNRAFYTMFGLSRDQTQGVPLYQFRNGAFELATVRTQLDQILAGGHEFQLVEVDHVSTTAGPRTLIVDARPLAFPGHAERRVLVTFQDITARKQAEAAKDLRTEEELRRSEAFLAEGQRLSVTGSFIWRLDSDAITFSDELRRIFELEDVPVTLERIVGRVHPDDVPLVTGKIALARAGVVDHDYDVRLRMPNGSIKYLRTYAHAHRHPDGRLEFSGAMQDVTQQRRSEEALGAARSELTRVARITSLGALTASITHEVNQPLSGMITNASTCLHMLEADPPNVEGARETARRMLRDGGRAAVVIARLRGLFTHKDAVTEPVDLNDAAREVIALSKNELERSGVSLRTDLAETLPPVFGDRIQLQQVILNLIVNASEAMSAMEDRARELTVRSDLEDGGGVRVSVQDNGPGFEPASIDRLFEAFYTTKTGGMGIGLSVSRSIVERHHGRLWATSNPGGGATFTFSLPADTKV
jgi:PAS domain S-box-containing protein